MRSMRLANVYVSLCRRIVSGFPARPHRFFSSLCPLYNNSTSKTTPAIPVTYIEPKSALYISGSSSQFVPFVVEPSLDFDAIFCECDQFQAELNARRLPLNIADLQKSWSMLQDLRIQRDDIEARRRKFFWGNLTEKEASQETKQEKRRLREELKEVSGKISAIESDTIVELLKLPIHLHKKAPLSEQPEVIFECLTGRSQNDSSAIWDKFVEYTDDAPRGYFLRGPLAELELRLISYTKNYLKKLGFASISGPHLYKAAVLEGIGMDLSTNQAKAIMVNTQDSHNSPYRSLFLASSPLENFAGYFTNCEVSEDILPLRLQSSGRIYRSLMDFPVDNERCRLFYPNQTHCISFCLAYSDPNQTDGLFDEILTDLREFYSALNVPFRITNRPAKELKTSEALRFQVEVWSPSLCDYVPCGYLAISDTFISRRLRCHAGKVEEMRFLSMIHGSFVDLTPFVACCLENFSSQHPNEWLGKILPPL